MVRAKSGQKKKMVRAKSGQKSIRNTTVSSTIVFFFFGISPAGRGIYPSAGGRNLDFGRCTIPTVGLYRKLGESLPRIFRTSSTSTELPPPPSAARRRLHWRKLPPQIAALRCLHRRKSPPLSPRLQSACFRRRCPHRCRRRHTATVALHRRRYPRCQLPLPPPS
jgi:hypothetical protein